VLIVPQKHTRRVFERETTGKQNRSKLQNPFGEYLKGIYFIAYRLDFTGAGGGPALASIGRARMKR
jgi:hypothetical protein